MLSAANSSASKAKNGTPSLLLGLSGVINLQMG